MIRIEQTITINRPVEEVFAFMTEAGNIFKYSRSAEEITQLTAGPLAVGSKFEIISRFLGRRIPLVLEVTEYMPNQRVSSESKSGPFILKSSTNYTQKNGATEVTVVSEIQPTGFWRVLEPILPGIIRRNSERDYETLRRTLEQQLSQDTTNEMHLLDVSKTIVSVQ